MGVLKTNPAQKTQWIFAKYFLIIFLSAATLVGVVLSLLYFANISREKETRETDEIGHVRLESNEINHSISSAISDLMIQANKPELVQIINGDESGNNFSELRHEFISLLKQKGVYDQVRYLDENGLEVIRDNYNNGKPAIVPDEKLQDKAHRYYFKETKKLQSGEVYISPYDLNIENKELEKPIKPMIRFSTPLYDDSNIFKGIMIINFMPDHMIRAFTEQATHPYQKLILLNSDGYILHGLKEDDLFGFMYPAKKDRIFAKMYPDAWAGLSKSDSGQFYTRDGLYTFNKVFPLLAAFQAGAIQADSAGLRNKYYIVLSHIPDSVITVNNNVHLFNILKIYAGIIILLLIGSYLSAKAIIDKRRVVNELKESEANLNEAQSIAHIGNWNYDIKNDTYTASDETYHIFGMEPQSIVEPDVEFALSLVHPDDREKIKRSQQNAIFNNKPYSIEYRAVMSDGSEKIVYSRAVIHHNDDGTPKSLSGTVQDITERKRAEEKLKKAYQSQLVLDSILQISLKDIPLEEQLDLSLKVLFSIPWLNIEAKGCISLVDDESETLASKAEYGLANEKLSKCKHVAFGECICGKAALTGELQRLLTEDHPTAYDSIRPHGHYCVPIISQGKTIGILNIYLPEGHKCDEPEVAFLEAVANTLASLIRRNQIEGEKKSIWGQLLQAQKMESIGNLTGGIAHDFNNLLTGIMGYADLANRTLDDDHPAKRMLNIIKRTSGRAAKLVQQLLAFSRKQVLDKRLNNLNIIIDDVTKMLTRMIGEDIELKINIKTEVSNVMVDEGQIEQVLLNLAINARHAMPKGGTLTISTEDIELNETYVNHHLGAKQGYYVMMSVSDTGAGMTKDVQKKIFEPFFTTKEKGKGTGLGLAMVYGIVKQHDGYIWVYSEEGGGTTFKVYFPAAKGQVLKFTREEPVTTRRGDETILIADDEDTIRLFLADMLESLGYKVLLAENGEEALKIADSAEGRIDLLLTDVIMTGMTGWELYEKISQTRPDIKTIFISGYMDSTDIHQKIQESKIPFISKPIALDDLLNRLNEALGYLRLINLM